MVGGGSASGTFEVSANAFLQFGGSYTLSVAASVTGAGSANFSSGTINAGGTYNLTGTNTFSGAAVNFSGNYALTNRPLTISAGAVNFNAGGVVNLTGLTLSGGTLGGTLPVPVNGPFAWSGGVLANAGGVTLNGTSSLTGAGNNSMQLDGLLINAGTLTWGGSGNNLLFASGTLTNLATGTITITADVSTSNGGGANVFGNAGLLRKTGGTGTTAMNSGVAFVNSGDVQVQSGTFNVVGGGSASGTFEVSANAFLQFGGSYTLSVAASVTGAGSANFSSGTINAGGTYNLPSILNARAIRINSESATMPAPASNNKCLILILPINISITDVAKNNAAVERFAGTIRMQTMITGVTIGINAFLKSFILSWFIESMRATYMISASLARSDVWIVRPIPGKVSHREAELIFVPRTSVSSNSGTEIYRKICDNLE